MDYINLFLFLFSLTIREDEIPQDLRAESEDRRQELIGMLFCDMRCIYWTAHMYMYNGLTD